MTEIRDVATLSELNDITQGNDSVVVKFWADWCQPCKRLKPHFDMAASKSSAIFVNIDIENCDAEILEKYGIRSVPTVLHFAAVGHYDFSVLKGRTSMQILNEIGEHNG